MQYYNGVIPVVKTLIFAAGASLIFMGGSQAQAMDNIEVMVCPAVNESSFVITQPQSDSIVNEPKLSITGEVKFISQIDFFIDDVYNNTIALGYAETQFSSDISLPPGTHTLKMVASDSCSQTTHQGSIVVTYEPKTPPSVGENVDTIIDGRVRQGERIPEVVEPEKGPFQKAIDRFVIPPLNSTKDALGFSGGEMTDPEVKAGNIARSVLFATGGLLALSAVHIGALSASVLPDRLASLLPFRRRAMTAVALIGLLLMLLVFIV